MDPLDERQGRKRGPTIVYYEIKDARRWLIMSGINCVRFNLMHKQNQTKKNSHYLFFLTNFNSMRFCMGKRPSLTLIDPRFLVIKKNTV